RARAGPPDLQRLHRLLVLGPTDARGAPPRPALGDAEDPTRFRPNRSGSARGLGASRAGTVPRRALGWSADPLHRGRSRGGEALSSHADWRVRIRCTPGAT